MIKKFLITLLLILILISLLIFFLIDKILVNKFISNIENNLNINIELIETHEVNIIPNLSLFIQFDVDNKINNFFIKKAELNIFQNYNNEPTKFIFKLGSAKINKLIIENLISSGEINKYNLRYFLNDDYSHNLISKFKTQPEGYIYYDLSHEEEKSLQFINLIINQLNVPKIYKKLSTLAYSLLTEKTYFTSKIRIDDRLILLDSFKSQKNNFQINGEGEYDLSNKTVDLKITINEKEEEIIGIKIKGNAENPNIKIISSDNSINFNFNLNDFNDLLEGSFDNILKNLISSE
ncbi:MAG: hypothetical protein HOF20_00140 [Pelagibacteraceae bacterium]|nr:hypothetical protein [Pelagibacteraceae bacterium]MBT4646599.1 hypothetical protein [Pelagibacteraceae bacterium]